MKTISIVNLKGGVGKTVTAVNLAGILAADYGKRVLLVDSDPQGDASQYIGVVPDACSTADLFDGGSAYYEDVIQHTIYRDLDIIPADMQLASVDLDADIDRKQAVRVYADLRDALVEDDAYDVMIFDCPPSFSLPCISAIAASDTVIVPIKPGAFEMAGMRLWHDPLGCPSPNLDDLFRLADWAGVDPFEMIAGHELSSVWHKYTEERPPEDARVLCKLCGCAGRYGEYIYKGGKWYFPDLDDEACEANILVSAWTEVFPE